MINVLDTTGTVFLAIACVLVVVRFLFKKKLTLQDDRLVALSTLGCIGTCALLRAPVRFTQGHQVLAVVVGLLGLYMLGYVVFREVPRFIRLHRKQMNPTV